MSDMQLRLREEYDVENAQTELNLSLDGRVLTYGLLENLCEAEMEIWG